MEPIKQIHIKMHLPWAMCENCSNPVKEYIHEECGSNAGYDRIMTSVEAGAPEPCSIHIYYNYQKFLEKFHGQSDVTMNFDPLVQQIRKDICKSVSLDGKNQQDEIQKSLYDRIKDLSPEELAPIEEITLVRQTKSDSRDLQSSSSASSKVSGVQKNRVKNRPSFVETVMQSKTMKAIQLGTMCLMVPMIPIMLSAIYVTLSRPYKKPSSGMAM